MKKLLLILCFLPMFSFGSTPYKILADTVFIGSIPYRTATGELLLFNNTKDTTESVLYNTGNGKTEFKKVRLIRLNDSTYVFKIGTTVIGDSIKIRSSGSGGGGGGSGTVTDFIFTDGNGFDGTVTSSTTTPTLSLVLDSITKFASVKRVLDSITALRNIRKVDSIYKKSTNRDLTYFKINGTEYSFKDSTGSSSQTLSISNDTLSISGGNTVVLPFIPLSGTVSGSPVTGDITAYDGFTIKTRDYLDSGYYNYSIFGDATRFGHSSDNSLNDAYLSILNTTGGHYVMVDMPSTSIGLRGSADYTPNITDLDYTQKIYVDGQIADTASLLRSLIGSGGAQTLSRTFADSISLSISGGNTVKIPYGVDSVSIVGDSLIVKKGAIRYSYLLITSGGSGTVTSVATNTGTGITGGTITSSGTLEIDTATTIATKSYVNTVDATKQATLVSSANIKTVNSTSLLGSGDISLPTATSTTTFTNKRITARVDSITSSATPTINTDNVDTYKLTAQAADITSFTTNLTGTPTDDQILHIVIIGTAARAITWGSKFESSTVTLPTTTVTTNRLDVYFIWNTATGKWRCGGTW